MINSLETAEGYNHDVNFNYQDDEVNATEPNRLVNITTNWGDISFELYEKRAPITTANFIKLTEQKFYDGIKFHRIIDDFVAQTGDPNTRDNNPYNDGMGGSDQTIPLEIHEELTHDDGAVGMARGTEEDSASSQFYICDGPQHGLDGDYAVFGIVIAGMDTVRKIAAAETYGYRRPLLQDHPVDDIVMEKVTIEPGIPEPLNDTEPDDAGRSDIKPGPGFEALPVLIGIVACVFIIRLKKAKRKP